MSISEYMEERSKSFISIQWF